MQLARVTCTHWSHNPLYPHPTNPGNPPPNHLPSKRSQMSKSETARPGGGSIIMASILMSHTKVITILWAFWGWTQIQHLQTGTWLSNRWPDWLHNYHKTVRTIPPILRAPLFNHQADFYRASTKLLNPSNCQVFVIVWWLTVSTYIHPDVP